MNFKLKYSLIFLFFCIIFTKINENAPNFYLRDINGSDFFLSDIEKQDKPLVLSFFATWCEPCRVELPLLDSLAIKYSSVNFVYIATGTENKPLKKTVIQKFKSSLDLNETILLDKYGRVFNKYSSNGMLPLTILINKGKIIYFYEKFEKESSIKNLSNTISQVLNES